MNLEARRILIGGCGPVGLLCAWLLARRGVPVRLFEENDGPQADPRAATTHPATLEPVERGWLGAGHGPRGLWRRSSSSWDRPAHPDRGIRSRGARERHRYPYVVQCATVQDPPAPPRAPARLFQRRDHVWACGDRPGSKAKMACGSTYAAPPAPPLTAAPI